MLEMSFSSIFLLLLEVLPLFVINYVSFSSFNVEGKTKNFTYILLLIINSLLLLNNNYSLLLNSLFSDVYLVSLFYFLYKRFQFNKNRNHYLKFFLLSSLIIINQIWNVLLFSEYQLFMNPNIIFLNSDFKSINFYNLIHISKDTDVINSLINVFVDAFIKAKIIMFSIWSISWGLIYYLANQSHKGTYKFGKTIPLFNGNIDWIILLFSMCFISYRTYDKTGITFIFSGIFALYLIHAVILFLVIYLFTILIKNNIKIKISVINILNLSIILICSHIFEWLHIFLSEYPSIYLFAHHNTPSFGTALSLTYLCDIMLAVWIIYFTFLKLKKIKFSINDNISIISMMALFSIIFLTHHFVIVPQINNVDDFNEIVFEKVGSLNLNNQQELIKEMSLSNSSYYKIDSVNAFKNDLEKCEVCKINSNQKIDFNLIKSKLDNKKGQSLSLKDCNVKLVYVVSQNNGQVIYNLNLANYNSFFTVLLYSIFYSIILLFWIIIIFTIEKIHKLKEN